LAYGSFTTLLPAWVTANNLQPAFLTLPVKYGGKLDGVYRKAYLYSINIQ